MAKRGSSRRTTNGATTVQAPRGGRRGGSRATNGATTVNGPKPGSYPTR